MMRTTNGILSMTKDEAVTLRGAVRELLVAESAALNEGPHALARRVLLLTLTEAADDLTAAIHHAETRAAADPEAQEFVIPNMRMATRPIYWAAVELGLSGVGLNPYTVERLNAIRAGL